MWVVQPALEDREKSVEVRKLTQCVRGLVFAVAVRELDFPEHVADIASDA